MSLTLYHNPQKKVLSLHICMKPPVSVIIFCSFFLACLDKKNVSNKSNDCVVTLSHYFVIKIPICKVTLYILVLQKKKWQQLNTILFPQFVHLLMIRCNHRRIFCKSTDKRTEQIVIKIEIFLLHPTMLYSIMSSLKETRMSHKQRIDEDLFDCANLAERERFHLGFIGLMAKWDVNFEETETKD